MEKEIKIYTLQNCAIEWKLFLVVELCPGLAMTLMTLREVAEHSL